MSNCDYNTCFKGVSSIGQELLLNIVEANLKLYFDWSFLNIGAWFDASIGNSTLYGGNNPSKLVAVSDPSYEDGRVWQGYRKDWVWEQGISYNNSSPINITTILVNNITKTNFIVDYPQGRIIFDTPISLSSNVQLSYSYRFIQVHRASESPWLDILQYDTFNTNNIDIKKSDAGEWSINSQHRIQLPCVVIEPVPRSKSRPYELGNNLLWLDQDIAFYVYAENKNDRNKILDIIRLQQDLTLQLYNTNTVAQNDIYPLNYNGSLKDNALMYPNLVQNYPWRKCFIKNINLFDMDSIYPNFHQGMARATLEIIST